MMKNVTLYISDEEGYNGTIESIKHSWYNLYKESLTKSEVILKSLTYFLQYTQGCVELPTKRDISKVYGRFPGNY